MSDPKSGMCEESSFMFKLGGKRVQSSHFEARDYACAPPHAPQSLEEREKEHAPD